MENRIIKFRGKTGNGNWVYGHYFYDPVHDSHTIIGQDGVFYIVKEETVGQFIGLADENETPIFKGDIIRLDNIKREVKWIGAGFWFTAVESSYKIKTDIEPAKRNSKRCRIIGNIYENPDLIK